MNDPVSRELERRAHLDLPWRWAIAGAVALHVAVAVALLAPSPHRRRALTLPSVQVRIVAAPAAGAPRAAAPARRPASEAVTRRRPKPAPEKPPAAPVRRAAARSVPAPASKAPAPKAEPDATTADAAAAVTGHDTVRQGSGASPSGGIGIGPAAAGDAAFPFTYYLNRALALVEANWFRPPAPAGTTCQVRCVIDRSGLCVIDRSGRLAEAGLESPSTSPAFDRAALRAVYAAAPFPPLPEGFGGSELTLHLEFGP